jgi:hypothetical protein
LLLYPCLPFYKKASTLRQKHFFGGPSRGPTSTDCSLPRSRSAVLSSPGWPFYKKSFHLTAEAFLWWGIQGPNTHGLMNSPLDCSLPRSRSAVLSSPAWPFYKKSFRLTAEAFLWWAIQDLNPGPSGYENVANFEILFFLWNLVTIS